MKILHSSRNFILAASALVLLAASQQSGAQIIIDDFTWYFGQNGTDPSAPVVNDGAVSITPPASQNSFMAWAYFDSISLTNIGDFVTLSFDFSVASVHNDVSQGLRFGLLDSGESLLEDDINSTSDEAFNGYTGYGTFYPLRTTTTPSDYSVRERVGGSNSLFTNGTGGFSTALETGSSTTVSANTFYNASLTITLTGANEITLASVINGNTLTTTDTTTLRTNFDTIAIFSDGRNGTMTFDNVTVTAVPEPSAMALLIGAASLLLIRRRRTA